MAVGTAVVLSSCAPQSLTALPSGVSVSVLQYRADYGPRVLQISVENDSATAVTVTNARFSSSKFEGVAEWTRDTDVPAGTTRDLRVSLGAPACAATGAEPATVALEFTTTDGRAGAATVVPADPFDQLAKISAQDCITERAAAIADIRVAGALRVEESSDGPRAMLDLSAEPTGAPGMVSVAAAGRTILLRPADGSLEWPLGWRVGADRPAAAATLAIQPNNCNPHVVAEDKRGTFFPLSVTLDDGTSGTIFVGVSTAVRGQIYAFVAQYCGW
jgi:hypothetical protein